VYTAASRMSVVNMVIRPAKGRLPIVDAVLVLRTSTGIS